MTPRARVAAVACVSTAVCVGALLLERARYGGARVDLCAQVGAGALDADGVRVLVGSALRADGSVTAGSVPRCDARADATFAFLVLRDAARASRWPDAPMVVAHFAPSGTLSGPRAHRPSAELLLPPGPLDVSVVAHELAHVVILHRRQSAPRSEIGRRLLSSIDEGVADYASAVATSRTVVGGQGGPSRDLGRPPRVSVEGWASLASLSTAFDPHVLGWDLAALLVARGGLDRALRDDVALAASAAVGEDVSDLLSSFVHACPSRSRSLLASVVTEWFGHPAVLRDASME